MMEPERDGTHFYPWVLYDSDEFYKPWSIQLMPELQIRRSFKNKSHFHVLINVKYISVDDISMKYDKEYLTIEGDYKEKKEQGYECYTSFKNIRRFKLPKGVDMNNVDTWTSKDGFLNILAPIDASPNENGQVTIYYPCANSKTVTDIAKRTLNCVQEYRFETMFKQLEAKKAPPLPAHSQSGKTRPPAEHANPTAGNRRAPTGHVCSSAGNMRAPNGNTRAPARNVHSSAGNMPSRAGTVQAPASNVRAPTSNVRAPTSNVSAPASNVKAPASNVRALTSNVSAPASNVKAPASNVKAPASNVSAPAGNIRAAENMAVQAGPTPRNNMYPETEVQVGNMYSASGNMYATEGDEYSSSGALMMGQKGNMRRDLRAYYNQANYEYEGGRYSREMYPSEYYNDYENIPTYNRYYIFPRKEYIYAAEMDPNSIIE